MSVRRYPKHRKSPYRHGVSEHKRDGRTVQKYMRGKGNKPHNPRRRRVVQSDFTVQFDYGAGETEAVSVSAANYISALERGTDERDIIKRPQVIVIRGVG